MAGYIEDPFVQFFVKKPSRRSPLINRGYFSRCYMMRLLVDAFLERCSGKPCQILSLGAGFDSTWFCLKEKNKQPARYIELDFEEVVVRKKHMILSNNELASFIGTDGDINEGGFLSKEYSIVSADLRDIKQLELSLKEAEFDPKMPTLILAECVLVYLESAESSGLIDYFGQQLTNAVFVIYEQIRPDDAFGRQMTSNLEARGCPLRGLAGTPSLTAHEQRMKQNGWKKAVAWDMDTIYNKLIPKEEHQRISKLEIFDEFEEWHMIQEHYCICVGSNYSSNFLKDFGFKGLTKLND